MTIGRPPGSEASAASATHGSRSFLRVASSSTNVTLAIDAIVLTSSSDKTIQSTVLMAAAWFHGLQSKRRSAGTALPPNISRSIEKVAAVFLADGKSDGLPQHFAGEFAREIAGASMVGRRFGGLKLVFETSAEDQASASGDCLTANGQRFSGIYIHGAVAQGRPTQAIIGKAAARWRRRVVPLFRQARRIRRQREY